MMKVNREVALMMPVTEKLGLTTKETAALLSISAKTVRRLIREQRLHAVRIGARRYLVPRDSIDRFLRIEEGPACRPGRKGK